ncbi:endoplasmic reticulum resident protein 27 [Indicator indicator]|uniref:endoplasmic reticulum resident protein 27 n=1 Tax=Indicator indicator TaxID=1002788 RepID=UPI0023DF1644|nr:endoplasmic reticulum resident protein 27 [Indicator indicator]
MFFTEMTDSRPQQQLTCLLLRKGPEQGGVVRRRQAGTMGTSVFLCLFVILLIGGAPVGCAGDSGSAGDAGSASNSTASTKKKPILLNNTADAEAFISGAEVVVVGFFQEPESSQASQFRLAADRIPEVPFGLSTSPEVLSHYGAAANTVTLFRMIDNDQRDLDLNNNDIDAEKMTRFVRMNELRLVTEYNPVTAIGVMQSSLELHLLLITDKMSPKHPERMRKYRAAAELFKGKVLFILIDINLKSNEHVLSFFKLKKSQLPALAVFHSPDEEQDVLTLDELSVELVQDFCNRFLQRLQKKQEGITYFCNCMKVSVKLLFSGNSSWGDRVMSSLGY